MSCKSTLFIIHFIFFIHFLSWRTAYVSNPPSMKPTSARWGDLSKVSNSASTRVSRRTNAAMLDQKKRIFSIETSPFQLH